MQNHDTVMGLTDVDTVFVDDLLAPRDLEAAVEGVDAVLIGIIVEVHNFSVKN